MRIDIHHQLKAKERAVKGEREGEMIEYSRHARGKYKKGEGAS